MFELLFGTDDSIPHVRKNNIITVDLQLKIFCRLACAAASVSFDRLFHSAPHFTDLAIDLASAVNCSLSMVGVEGSSAPQAVR